MCRLYGLYENWYFIDSPSLSPQDTSPEHFPLQKCVCPSTRHHRYACPLKTKQLPVFSVSPLANRKQSTSFFTPMFFNTEQRNEKAQSKDIISIFLILAIFSYLVHFLPLLFLFSCCIFFLYPSCFLFYDFAFPRFPFA